MRGLQERGALAALSGPSPSGSSPADVARSARRLLLALGVAGVVVLVDQVTKSLAVAHLERPRHLLGPLGLGLGYNSGAAFSLFTGRAAVLAVVALAIVTVLVYLAWRTRRARTAVAIGLVLGGALGNVADRAFRGHHGSVVDFVTLTHWPTFNVADTSIVVGGVLLVVFTLFPGETTPSAAPAEGPTEPTTERRE